MKKTYAVLGLGRFGLAVVEGLAKQSDAEVIAIDQEEALVARAAEFTNNVYICDTTNRRSLEEVNIQSVDHVVVAIGSNIEATILTTLIVKDLGIEKITVRVDEDLYGPVMLKLGATSIISPQKLAGQRLANRVLSDKFADYFNIEGDFGIVEVDLSETWKQITIEKLDLRNRFNINILLINRKGKLFSPSRGTQIKPQDTLFIFGKREDIIKFDETLNK